LAGRAREAKRRKFHLRIGDIFIERISSSSSMATTTTTNISLVRATIQLTISGRRRKWGNILEHDNPCLPGCQRPIQFQLEKERLGRQQQQQMGAERERQLPLSFSFFLHPSIFDTATEIESRGS
jgi:hypothetical protein